MTRPATTARSAARAGFSIVEVMIAMVMLAIIVTGLAAGSLSMAAQSKHMAARTFATGLLTQEVDRAVAVPIESLAVKLGTTTLDTPVLTPWPVARRIGISGRADSLTVSIAILPIKTAQRRDSATQAVLRTR